MLWILRLSASPLCLHVFPPIRQLRIGFASTVVLRSVASPSVRVFVRAPSQTFHTHRCGTQRSPSPVRLRSASVRSSRSSCARLRLRLVRLVERTQPKIHRLSLKPPCREKGGTCRPKKTRERECPPFWRGRVQGGRLGGGGGEVRGGWTSEARRVQWMLP